MEEFIERNPGLNKESIVDAMADYSSKKVVYTIIDELKNTERIIEKKPNKREMTYFSNNNSEYIIIKRQIAAFKKSYSDLIQKSFDHPLFKDTIGIMTKTIVPEDNIKTRENLQTLRSLPYEYRLAEEVYKVIRLALSQIEYHYSNLYNSIYHTNLYKYAANKSTIEPEEVKQIARDINIITVKTRPVIDRYYTVVRSSIYSRIHFWIIYIFLIFSHLITLRSATIWPNIVKDMKEQSKALDILNKLAYDEILSINTLILKSFSDSGDFFELQETIYSIPGTFQFMEKQSIMQMSCDFKSIELENELEIVMESLRKISNDDKNIISLEFYLEKINEFCNQVLNSKDP